MKVFITRPIPGDAQKIIENAGHEVVVSPENRVLSPEELQLAAAGFDGVLSFITDRIDQKFFEAVGDQLKVVANFAVGFDNIDLDAARQHGVVVTNTPGILSGAVAEHTLALMLAITQRVCEADRYVRDGKFVGWEPDLFLGMQLQGKTLGIIGSGRIGYEVAKRAYNGFEMKVVYNDIQENEHFDRDFRTKLYSLEDVLRNSDVVSLHVPLLPSTKHLLNADRLALLKPTSYLVNTSRGVVVDEVALVDALRQNKIRGAALDVFEHEPKLSVGLSDLQNVVLAPHFASANIETRSKMSEMAAANIVAVLAGNEAPNVVHG